MGNGLSDRKADTQELMQIRQEAYEAASQLLAAAHPKKGSILVVGCSTSEVAGERIGSFSVRNWDRRFLTAYIRQLRKRRYFWPPSAVSI